MIFLIFFLVLLFLIFLILISPVRIRLSFSQNFELSFKFLFFSFYFGEKTKKYKSKIKKKSIKLKKKKSLSILKDFKKSFKNKEKKDIIVLVLQVLKELIVRFKFIYNAVKLDKLFLKIVVASEDASETISSYVKVCGLVYPFVSFLASSKRVKDIKINIFTDFLREKVQVLLEVKIHLTLARILLEMFKLLFFFLRFGINSKVLRSVKVKNE
ncbi:MAG: hypothetical protein LBF33_02810 [Oscillospiraceae bacterium]|nr:hypothetical protein [Oscillospiraceae bacterium]